MKFPIIRHIEDVLPAVEGRDEFVVAERPGYTVINYNVGFEDTFTIDPDETMVNDGVLIPKGLMRRECRGIIFDTDGWIMSRPFHKFFNVGEREETLIQNIDMSRDHVIMEKMDGSMIRPMWYDESGTGDFGFGLGTKMGITDTAVAAHKIIRKDQTAWMIQEAKEGRTPLVEFVSPENRIVIEYDTPDLVLLAVRVNLTGEYLDIEQLRGKVPFTVVPTYGQVEGDFAEYLERERNAEGREGFIISFGGEMHKGKNDWYVRIHKVKDKIRTDRHIAALLMANDLDDVYPHLDVNDFNRVKKYEADFHVAWRNKVRDMEFKARDAWLAANFNKKDLATQILPKSGLPKDEWAIVFKFADGKDVGELITNMIMSKLGNTTKYNELAEFLGLSKDGEEE